MTVGAGRSTIENPEPPNDEMSHDKRGRGLLKRFIS